VINIQPLVTDLNDRILTAVRLIDETHPKGASQQGPISREARGLAIVLLFAAYENLLRTLTRTLLEEAVRLRVGNRRLQPGFRAFALVNSAKSIRDLSQRKVYSHGLPRLVRDADPGGRVCTIDSNSFPDDGSFMKQSQISLWCSLFGIADPHTILRRSWTSVDAVVVQRNEIAHGRETPDDVGRRYTEQEIRLLIVDWHADWLDFLVDVGQRAANRAFFRVP
jgi:hypothetical protein